MKKIILFISLLLPLTAISGEWSGLTNIKKIYPHSTNNTDGTIYLGFDVMKNASSCTHSSLLALKKSNNLSSEIYSLILTAYAKGSRVNYYTQGCDSHGYPELLHITVTE